MAYKTFANGFPLPASDLNNFLMNQSVIVFADSAARTTAIPSPVEGMLTYLEDTNAYESWNGSAYVALVEDPDLTALIPKSTVTTAQDLIVADGASSVTRLGVGTDDQVLSVVGGEVAWADASGGGGGFDTVTEITASNASYDVSGISGFAKFTIIGAGGGGSGASSSSRTGPNGGSNGGSSSVIYGATTVTATGGSGANASSGGTVGQTGNSAPGSYVSSNWGNFGMYWDSTSTDNFGRPGLGGLIKVVYADLTGLSGINVTIGAGGAGGTSSYNGAAGQNGLVIMEYSI